MDSQMLTCDGNKFAASQVASPPIQLLLARARENSTPLLCGCKTPGVPMVTRLFRDNIFVARWPETGNLHHPECPSFDLDSHTSAVHECEDGVVEIRASFSLEHGASTPAKNAPHKVTAAPVVARQTLGLDGVLLELWRLAGLGKWFPKMNGRRSWGLARHLLAGAAVPVRIGTSCLADHLFVPESFHSNDAEHGQRQSSTLRKTIADHGLALVVAPISAVESSRFGYRIVFTHMRPLRMYSKKCYGIPARRNSMRDGDRLIGMAIVDARGEHFRVLDMGLLPVTAHWLPYGNPQEAIILDDLVAANYKFLMRSTRQAGEIAVVLEAGDPTFAVIPDAAEPHRWRFERIPGKEMS